MKVALYARVSTDKQDAMQQLADCQIINKWGEVSVFEEHQTAWKDTKERPEFDKLLAFIKKRQLEHLIVWDLDRIYRNRLRLIDFFKLCKVCGCQVHSFRQAWLEEIQNIPTPWNDIMFDLMLNIMGWLAEEESSKKSDRVKKAVVRKEGTTLSFRGLKWGRKQVSTQKKNQLRSLWEAPTKLSVRDMAQTVSLGVGTVHKYITQFELEKQANFIPEEMVQLMNDKKGGSRNLAALKVFEEVLAKEAPKMTKGVPEMGAEIKR